MISFIFSITIQCFFHSCVLKCCENEDHSLSSECGFYIHLILALDFFVTFNTGYYEKGSLIKNRKKIIKNYLFHGTFISDLITYISIYFIPSKFALLYLYKIFKI